MAVRPHRRLVALLVCIATVVLIPRPAFPAAAQRELRAGERGSGPPAWRLAVVAASDVRWSDVPNDLWARGAIDFVAGTNAWMRDFNATDGDGRYAFRPDAHESRRFFAPSGAVA